MPNNKPLSIIQTPPRYPPYIGGVEKYVFDLSNQLVKKQVAVTVVCANEPTSIQERMHGVVIKRLASLVKIENTNITPSLFITLLRTPCDIIHTHIPTPWSADISALVSWIKRKPLIITYHNVIAKRNNMKLLAALYNRFILKLVLAQAQTIIITQPEYVNSCQYLQQFPQKIVVIPNGIDEQRFQTKHTTKQTNQIFFLSSLDRHHRYKGLDTLIRAIALIARTNPTVRLVIGGTGALVQEYAALANALGIVENVTFLGKVPDADLNDVYQQSRVFVLPSNGNEEGFGIVLLEAMANAIPVITTNFAGVAQDIRTYNTGLIVPENNPKALSSAISTILDHRSLAHSMGQNGKQLVAQKYTWQKITNKVLSVYQHAL